VTDLAHRERRVGLALPLEVRGTDTHGVSFSDSTTTLNVSGGGLLFRTERSLLVGSPLTLSIQVPSALRQYFKGRVVYRVHGVVCRVERFEGAATSSVGVRFLAEIEGSP
jgi:hypothetical protein